MRTISLLVLVSLMIGAPALAQTDAAASEKRGAPATRPATQTVGAKCSLRITWDARLPHVWYEQFILEQPATKEAGKAILNVDDLRRVLTVENIGLEGPPTERGVSLRVDGLADIEGARPAAAEFLDAIIAELPKQLQGYRGAFVMEEFEAVHDLRRRAEAELVQLRERRAERLRRLRELTGRSDAAANWTEAVANLEQERQKLTLDLAGQQARRQAIEATIAKISKQAEARVAEDDIGKELAKIVHLREKEWQSARDLQVNGRMNASEVTNVEAKVADARARLLERRELAARAAGGELLIEFNRELLTLSISAAENEARLELIRKTLNGFVEAAADVEQLELLEKNMETQEAAYLSAKKAVAAVEEKYRNLREPKVTVLNRDYMRLEQARKQQQQQQQQQR